MRVGHRQLSIPRKPPLTYVKGGFLLPGVWGNRLDFEFLNKQMRLEALFEPTIFSGHANSAD